MNDKIRRQLLKRMKNKVAYWKLCETEEDIETLYNMFKQGYDMPEIYKAHIEWDLDTIFEAGDEEQFKQFEALYIGLMNLTQRERREYYEESSCSEQNKQSLKEANNIKNNEVL